MATFFGEVLPVHSRAVDDDDDEESEVLKFRPAAIKWNPAVKDVLESVDSDKTLYCSTVVISIGPAASGFTHAYLLSSDFDVVAALSTGFSDEDRKQFEPQSVTDKSCRLYRSRHLPGYFLCICNATVSPEQTYSWTTELFEHINLSEADAVILSSSPTSEYRTDKPVSELTVPFVKALTTGAFTDTPVCQYLEQPNMVNGLPAQILTHLHIQNVKAVLYVCYTDTIFLDSRTVKAFCPLLKSAPFKNIIKPSPKADETLKKMMDLHTTANTLYL